MVRGNERNGTSQERATHVLTIHELQGMETAHIRIEPTELLQVEPDAYGLCVAVEGLDTLNDLPRALLAIRFALRQDSPFIGALAGGDTLPALRAAMRAADEEMGGATPHVHPRIEPAGLAGLLSDAGFTMPVVDVDRVEVGYRSLSALVRDLRAMGATNQLTARSRTPLTRSAAAAAASAFEAQASNGRIRGRVGILHFPAWTPRQAHG